MKNILIASIVILSQVLSAEPSEFSDSLHWEQVQNLPGSLELNVEISGYLSIFKINDFWHIYVYDSRESLKDHRRRTFFKIGYESFGKVLGFIDADVDFLKALDQRLVRVRANFRTPDYAASDYALELLELSEIKWRNREGKWTSSIEDCKKIDALESGKKLHFPEAIFFDKY